MSVVSGSVVSCQWSVVSGQLWDVSALSAGNVRPPTASARADDAAKQRVKKAQVTLARLPMLDMIDGGRPGYRTRRRTTDN
jgi:hypothetical protein